MKMKTVGWMVAVLGLVAVDAFAIIGRPLTPLSYAGVARRTTRRAVYATGAAAAASTMPYYYW